jgi:type I restriction-modification system DNA methylase subunit
VSEVRGPAPPNAEISAARVLAEAAERYGQDQVGARELADTYESMQAMATRKKSGVWYTPEPVVKFMSRFALEQAIGQVKPDEPGQILRIVACDPACGCGVFLVEAAQLLAANYAGRLFGAQPTGEQVMAVLPTVILWSVFGMDIDPVAAELSRIALSLETGGVLTPAMLERHVVCADPLSGGSPPAMDDRTGPPVKPMEPAR